MYNGVGFGPKPDSLTSLSKPNSILFGLVSKKDYEKIKKNIK